MYQPTAFIEHRPDRLHALIRAHPFGLLISGRDGQLQADPLPWMLDTPQEGPAVLRGHLARANPHWQRLAEGDAVLVAFTGEQGYVSPSWYPSKQRTGKAVPTWNYAMAQVHGPVRVVHDRDWLLALVTALTDAHEPAGEARWHVCDAPADYIETMLRAIVGVEVRIERIEGKVKMSQNRSAEDRAGVVQALSSQADPTLRHLGRAVSAATQDEN